MNPDLDRLRCGSGATHLAELLVGDGSYIHRAPGRLLSECP
jgi:hypothetical protein